MENDALGSFIDDVTSSWGPLTGDLVADCSLHLQCLLKASPSENWLEALHTSEPENQELHRDRAHGFMLLAHTERAGLYRPPHDHGRGWVIYAVQHGEVAMCSYARLHFPDGHVRLVKRNRTLVHAGQIQVYLPGDIHDTRCMTCSALLYRFTDRDLRVEDRQERRVTRYVEREGFWTPGPA